MGKIWTGEERCTDPQSTAEAPACSQALLRGQTLIGRDGRLTRVNTTQGELELMATVQIYFENNTNTNLEEATLKDTE